MERLFMKNEGTPKLSHTTKTAAVLTSMVRIHSRALLETQ
jgi:N6-adenosine-specific RNA methylase IME4